MITRLLIAVILLTTGSAHIFSAPDSLFLRLLSVAFLWCVIVGLCIYIERKPTPP